MPRIVAETSPQVEPLSTPSGLIRDGVDRERMLDMDRRLAPVRRRAVLVLGVALLASAPWIGWWTLAPLVLAGRLLGLASRRIATSTRPEYALFAAWLASEVLIAGCVALTGGPTGSMLCWLAIPMVTLAARFSDRAVALGLACTIVLLLGVAFGVDANAVIADPTRVIGPLALILVLTLTSVELMHSDAEHRGRAVLDPLTSMLNRTALERRVNEIAQQSTITGEPVGMILADIDRFKSINDDHGHGTGDAVLRHVAYIIRKQLRAFDLAYRLGGEEFLILVPGALPQSCGKLAERVRVAVEREHMEEVHVTISCGVAGSPRGSRFDYDAVFRACDRALYEAKRRGRNQVRGCNGESPVSDPLPTSGPDRFAGAPSGTGGGNSGGADAEARRP